MDIFDALILGILQGITEFLPVSSSGHLVIFEDLLGLKVQSLKSFDVAVHVATLLAILIYFRRDIGSMIHSIFSAKNRLKSDMDMIFYIIIGTIPAIIIGLTAEDFIDEIFRNILAVALMMIIVAVIFILGEKFYRGTRVLNWRKAVVIGCAQAVALIPGVSRSGSTIVAGIFQGISREDAARFSFLLGIPAMAGAGILTVFKNGDQLLFGFGWPMVVGFVTSFIFGLMSISFLMRFLKKHSLLVFALYLLMMGGGVILSKIG